MWILVIWICTISMYPVNKGFVMKRVFIFISLIIGLLNTVSCQPVTSQKTVTEEDSPKISLSLKMDSILVEYCNYTRHTKYMSYFISFSNSDKIVITSGSTGLHKYPSVTVAIDSIDLVKSFVTLINKLYLDKTEKIILERKKTNLMIDADYPSFFITGYKKGKKVVNESTDYSDNELFVFNPLFHEFHELTRKLVKFVDDELELKK